MASQNKSTEHKQQRTQPTSPQPQAPERGRLNPHASAVVILQRTASTSPPSPGDLLTLQRTVGNRALNRQLAALPPVRPSISRASGMTVQRVLSEKTFTTRATHYGYGGLEPELTTGLVAIINAVIRKYPDYEASIVDNLEELFSYIEPTWRVSAHVPRFLRKLEELLRDDGLENFEHPEGVWDIGKPPPQPQTPVSNNNNNSTADKEGASTPKDQEPVDPDELAARQGLPQPLGTARNGIVSVNQRPTAHLTMGQGLVANLGQLILFSDQFSSCSPVIMFNAGTHEGGLFHFPAGSLEQQAGNLKNMYQRVTPTHIVLNDRGIVDPLRQIRSTDHDSLQDFFVKELGFQGQISVQKFRSDQYAVTLAPDSHHLIIETSVESAGGSLSVFHDRTGEGRRQVAKAWQGAPAATKFGRDDWHTRVSKS